MAAAWFLYECVDCGTQTFHGPEGGDLNECERDCPNSDTFVTPLYVKGDGVIPPCTRMSSLIGASRGMAA